MTKLAPLFREREKIISMPRFVVLYDGEAFECIEECQAATLNAGGGDGILKRVLACFIVFIVSHSLRERLSETKTLKFCKFLQFFQKRENFGHHSVLQFFYL
jgi:hypothetical protein